MTDKKTELEVGDRIYCIEHDSITAIHTIVRTTKTQAISDKETRFTKKGTSLIRVVGAHTYSMKSHLLETPALKQRLTKQNLIRKIKKFNIGSLSVGQLKELLETMEGFKTD